MKLGDLVRAKNPRYYKGIGIIICDTLLNPWENAVRVYWFTCQGKEDVQKCVMRVYDLEPVF